jgi:hypothetical protein
MRRRGEVSPRRLSREWPRQVAIRADQLLGDQFCRGLSVAAREYSCEIASKRDPT